jgi:phosphoglycolate phosphatase
VGDASKRLQATSATISGMARHDALLFDFDGTIADSRVPYTRSLNHALAEVGLPTHAPEDLYQYLGPPMQQTLTEFLQVPAELVDRVTALYRELYAQIGPTETRAYDGIPELLRTLHGRLPLAVATSKILPLAEMLLEQMGLRELFDVVAAPAPDVVNESKSTTIASALAALDQPAAAVMIGDRFYDVVGASAHGLPTVGVLWGSGSEQELREAGARWLAKTPDEIPGLLGL